MAYGTLPNTPNARPIKNRSQAYAGKAPAEILKLWARKFQPLPAPAGKQPYHYNLEDAIPGIGQAAAKAGKIVFQTVGDTGPYVNGDYHPGVVKAMLTSFEKPGGEKPAFFYHLGDVVYNFGRREDYYDQFYKPYHPYTAPIFSIPGNHDGDPSDARQPSLDGWVDCFMGGEEQMRQLAKDATRPPVRLPNVYYTLNCPFVTIIGLYTNVPEHGFLGSAQQQWFEREMLAAPADKALVVCLHNPVYSFDGQHSGSPLMGEALAAAINSSRRVPNMVLSAHVHNYQQIEKEIVKGRPTPFFVAGNGGYPALHGITSPEGSIDPETGAVLVKGQDKRHGFVEITVDEQSISGESITVDDATGVSAIFDSFSYPADAFFLEEGKVVTM